MLTAILFCDCAWADYLATCSARMGAKILPKNVWGATFGEKLQRRTQHTLRSQDARSAQHRAPMSCAHSMRAARSAGHLQQQHRPHEDDGDVHMAVSELALTSHVGVPMRMGCAEPRHRWVARSGARRRATQVPWSREQRRHYQVHRKAIDDDRQCEQGQNKCHTREDACAQVPVRVSKP